MVSFLLLRSSFDNHDCRSWNKYTWYGALAAVLVGVFVVYIPAIQEVFQTTYVNPLSLCSALVMGIILVCYEYFRHFLHHRGYFGGMKNIKSRTQEATLEAVVSS
jgi:uncharacterized membrane protein